MRERNQYTSFTEELRKAYQQTHLGTVQAINVQEVTGPLSVQKTRSIKLIQLRLYLLFVTSMFVLDTFCIYIRQCWPITDKNEISQQLLDGLP